MESDKKRGLFQTIGDTSMIPISAKIVIIVSVFLLISNFATNYLTISLLRRETMEMNSRLLARELKEIYINAGNQYQIFLFSGNKQEVTNFIALAAEKSMTHQGSWAVGVFPSGEFLFQTKGVTPERLPDKTLLDEIIKAKENGTSEGARFFDTPYGEYFGVYKYHEEWDVFLLRADLMADLMHESNEVFKRIVIIIVVLTIIFMTVSFLALLRILRFVKVISRSLYNMQQRQELTLIDLKEAPADDITYLGVSFNSLASSINNLLGIFRKFASRDVVNKAYRDRIVNLEGEQRELTVLFTDIRSFTNMTETLGNDIIDLLNLHYNSAIHIIHNKGGIVGSIIGDALLAVYGADEEMTDQNKSLAALLSAWKLQDAASELRNSMLESRNAIEKSRALTPREEDVFKAVMLAIGVGIDGGTVFYGTIGSNERMTNTVIGDNVNSASRIEGLTRIYQLPIIVSEYVKDDIQGETDRFRFFEIDTVQVKGKTKGKKVFYPLDVEMSGDKEIAEWETFEKALTRYYDGNWDMARIGFNSLTIPVAEVFKQRVNEREVPEGWNGIWTMTSK
ncbi:MAG: adenylate/guanylate cyclase domain-containing protein [Treponema sp.]|jgi:class 3 adenylate cyclase|nr:adenylate/guanylate cyclase domain-containing protein [Treponema sp.]